jgi:hypothetical protein
VDPYSVASNSPQFKVNQNHFFTDDNSINPITTFDDNTKATFVGTRNSTIGSGIVNSVIVGGLETSIGLTSFNNVIIGGRYTYINDAGNSVIVGGDGSYINDSINSVINGGVTNDIDASDRSFIGGGSSNGIRIGSDRSGILAGITNTINNNSVYSTIVGGQGNTISDDESSSINGGRLNRILNSTYCGTLGGLQNDITSTAQRSVIIGGEFNEISGSTNSAIICGDGITATFDNTVYQQDSYRDAGTHIVTTNNNTITDLYTFVPDTNGVWVIEWRITGFENATGDALGATAFATFKVIAGVVTQVSTTTLDRKSNFPASVTVTLDTDGTVIRARVTGRTGSTIDWKGSLTITK